jgi:hypothetical protein
MKNRINSFEDFMKSRLLEKDEVEQSPEAWDQYFSDVKDSKAEAGKDPSQGELPDWAKKALEQDALKGKSADERWSWLKERVEKDIKDKQTSKVEEIKAQDLGGMPGYRLLWKEEKTETGDQQDKSGNVYKVYYTEIYKGNPGTWIDKKDEGGKPGAPLGKGYWGQNSRVPKVQSQGATGATGSAPSGVAGGILWVDEPEKVAAKGGTGSLGEMKLIDLFAETEMGQSVLTAIMGDPEMLKKLKKDGKIDFTDSPATADEIEKDFTAEQKEVQKKNIEKLKSMGQSAVRPDFNLVSSPADYKYQTSSKDLSWSDIKSALKNAGADSKLDFEKWNIVGIRNTLAVKNQYQNRFTDLIVLMSPEDKKQVKIYPITTTPGPAFAYVPFRNWWLASALKDTINPDGVAILQPGVYEYAIGNHKGYTALVQSGQNTVGRIEPVLEPEKLKLDTFSPSKKQTGQFGINIHKAMSGDTPTIDSWSAGCQVFKNGGDFSEFMNTLQKDANQRTYKYALINSSDIKKKGSNLA